MVWGGTVCRCDGWMFTYFWPCDLNRNEELMKAQTFEMDFSHELLFMVITCSLQTLEIEIRYNQTKQKNTSFYIDKMVRKGIFFRLVNTEDRDL